VEGRGHLGPVPTAFFAYDYSPESDAGKVWATDEITVIKFGHDAIPRPYAQLTVEVGQSFELVDLHLERTGHGVAKEEGPLVPA
jgi:hypothetical protein